MTWLRPVGLGVGLLALVLLLSLLRGGDPASSSSDVSSLSPYLQSGYSAEDGGVNRFVGRLTPAWAFVQTNDRVSAATEIGEALDSQGIDTVLLVDQRDVVQVRYEDGKILHLEPKGR
jgi:thiamine biosynthesis lipoprotein ApbE